MATFCVYLSRSARWIIHPDDALELELPAHSSVSGWCVLNPLVWVGSGSTYKPQVIPLPDGTRFVATDRITFTTQASDPEAALEIALLCLRWMRFVSSQASLGVDILGYEVQPDGPLTHLEISHSIAPRVRLLKNVEGTALTFSCTPFPFSDGRRPTSAGVC